MYIARERTENARQRGEGDRQGLPFREYQTTTTPSSTPSLDEEEKDRQNERGGDEEDSD